MTDSENHEILDESRHHMNSSQTDLERASPGTNFGDLYIATGYL